METNFDCIIIGAGAAGMFAAITAASEGYKTAVIEPNEKMPHRMIMKNRSGAAGTTALDAVREILATLRVPKVKG